MASDDTIRLDFVCVHNAGRSQMAAAFAERDADFYLDCDPFAEQEFVPLNEDEKRKCADQCPQQIVSVGSSHVPVATASISIAAPFGSASTPTALRAGGLSWKYSA